MTLNKQNKRSPIVTIMGHVDHGKTTLIDYIRKSKLTQKEKGNITQHINAYNIITKYGNIIFLDTPGHKDFINLRKRGIKITDLIILIVAIDDGIMPQTIEIINYAKIYKVPIIIAINKIDKQEYIKNIETLKLKISKYGIIPNKWGGNNIFVKISAKLGIGIKKLLKYIFIETKKKINLKINIKKKASGIILESSIDKGKGPIATILILNGTLNIGDIIQSNNEYGKIRAIYNEKGEKIYNAIPSIPVQITGLYKILTAGNNFITINNISNKKIKKKIKKTKHIHKTKNIKDYPDNFFSKDKQKKINLIIKADVYGSLETILRIINKISFKNNNIINIVSSGIGSINEIDILLASTSKSIILIFNVKINNFLKKKINNLNIKIKFYSIIYNLSNYLKKLITKKNKKNINTNIIGKALIKNIFKSSPKELILGCLANYGFLKKNYPINITRNNHIIYKGTLKYLKRFKNNVDKIINGTECGIKIKNFNNIKIGDIIEVLKKKNKNE